MMLDEKVKSADVALICMPFMATDRPSLGLSLIKAGLTAQGVSSSIYYLNLIYAMMAGLDKINTLELFPEADLVKEWIFTESCWGENKKRDAQYTENVLKGGLEEHRVNKPEMKYSDYKDEVLHCKDKIESFLEYCINEIPWSNYKIVGFSSIFQQQISSISLAKRIKKQFPHLFIVFGGASCKGESGKALLKSFPFIDAVCLGEGDIVFPQFVRAFLDKKLSADFPGIITQTNKSDTDVLKIPPSDLNELPYPDYQDFFQQVEQYDHLFKQNLLIMLESSRGCWWGEKSQCSFCGLNGTDLRFRQKTAKNVLDEIIWMLDQYGCYTREFWASDCIMPKEYIKTLLPRLKKLNLDIKIFYEIKSNQKKEHIQLFHDAGVTGIQPGIESLSTSVLKLMGKGVTSLQNIQLLKNCLMFGVFPEWNYLVGFPGETCKDYKGQSDLIPALVHLPPPHSPGIRRIRFDRFSPYHSDPVKYNLQHMHPYHSYQYIFPTLSEKVIEQIAYYFVCDFNGKENISLYTDSIKEVCKKWLNHHHKAALFTIKEEEALVLYDFRPGFPKSSFVLKDDVRMVFEACEQIQKKKYLKQLLNDGTTEDDDKLYSILDPMLSQQWIIEENDQFLSLAIPLGYNYFPPEGVWHEFQNIMAADDNNGAE